jgi:hypothetical protein
MWEVKAAKTTVNVTLNLFQDLAREQILKQVQDDMRRGLYHSTLV